MLKTFHDPVKKIYTEWVNFATLLKAVERSIHFHFPVEGSADFIALICGH